MKGNSVLFIAWIMGLALTGCISTCPQLDPQTETISLLDDHLIPLSKAVDVVADRLPPDATDQEIIKAAVERSGNPRLVEPFAGYLLKARTQQGIGVLLVCTKDGKDGFIEDVSCTTRPDAHRPSGSPCKFMLDVQAVCAAR